MSGAALRPAAASLGSEHRREWRVSTETKYDWARDADPLFTFLGLYLATFQWMDSQLDQIILMAEGFDQWSETQTKLAKMDNRSRIDAMAGAAVDVSRFPLVGTIDDWRERVETVVGRLHNERRRRNRIMHSQYLMEGVEHGLPVIRSVRTRGEAEEPFDQEELSRPRMDAILEEIAAVGFAVGLITAQLRQAIPRETGH